MPTSSQPLPPLTPIATQRRTLGQLSESTQPESSCRQVSPPSVVAKRPDPPPTQQLDTLGQEMSFNRMPDCTAGTASSCQRAPPSVVTTTASELPSSPVTVSPAAKQVATSGQLIALRSTSPGAAPTRRQSRPPSIDSRTTAISFVKMRLLL